MLTLHQHEQHSANHDWAVVAERVYHVEAMDACKEAQEEVGLSRLARRLWNRILYIKVLL
jgi:hypothetical protein